LCFSPIFETKRVKVYKREEREKRAVVEKMQHLVLVVEDDEKILFNIKMILELNNYKVIGALNCEEALKTLLTSNELPDIILSDIVMPKMDGYDFFRAVSSNPQFSHIPFIFVSARAEPDDIRFGKMLGADDYITKPFRDEDLLAVIIGKLNRYEKIKFINVKMNEIFSYVYKDLQNSKQLELFMVVSWDNKFGPRLECYFPKEKQFPFNISQISIQLYESISTIYGQKKAAESAQGILIHADNINKDAYLFFDQLLDLNDTGEVKQYMLAVIADKIPYFNSLKIKNTLTNISNFFKKINKIDCKLTESWKTLQDNIADLNSPASLVQ